MDHPDQSVLTEEETKGRDSIAKRVKAKEILLSYTDKDGRVVISTPEVYIQAAEVHLNKDEKVSWEVLKPTELTMNRTAVMLEKMFKIGSNGTNGQRDRIRKAVIGRDQGAPTVKYLWKTHKQYTVIPPTRPVCDASKGPISRTSSIL